MDTKKDEKKEFRSFYISARILERLDIYSTKECINKSQKVEQLIDKELKEKGY
jgi:hypothetical protein